jgi:hypothetical protein
MSKSLTLCMAIVLLLFASRPTAEAALVSGGGATICMDCDNQGPPIRYRVEEWGGEEHWSNGSMECFDTWEVAWAICEASNWYEIQGNEIAFYGDCYTEPDEICTGGSGGGVLMSAQNLNADGTIAISTKQAVEATSTQRACRNLLVLPLTAARDVTSFSRGDLVL